MILDRFPQAERYAPLHPGFAQAFAFLKRADLRQLPLAKYAIDGDRVYATIARSAGRTRQEAKLEAHRKYIDIQVVLDGVDQMGWKSIADCRRSEGPYDEEKDVELLADAPDAWIDVGPGTFTIFYPEDAHAPLVGTGEIYKVVVKVAVEMAR
jgi:YhcH/YjgK/YiaL family protein